MHYFYHKQQTARPIFLTIPLLIINTITLINLSPKSGKENIDFSKIYLDILNVRIKNI